MAASATWSVNKIRLAKGRTPLAVLTAYDYLTARLMDECGMPMILVGDSLAMTVLGYENTLPVTMDEMMHHTKAVVRGVKKAVVVADMPFLSYQVSEKEAVANAGLFLKEAGADAVKIEGGAIRESVVKSLVENGIPVMGHIGLTPQSVKAMGYKVQGKTGEQAEALLEDAQALDRAGVFSLVLEGMPAELSKQITDMVSCPTIGIGAGLHCDGQVLVVQDMLGLTQDMHPKFVKKYADLGQAMTDAFTAYREDVESRTFPDDEHSY